MRRPAGCSVVVPAHDEASVLRDRLGTLVHDLGPHEADVVLVANGCTDDTAAVARGLPGVQVIEVPAPSKTGALNAGDLASPVFPRVYLDADVRLTAPALRRMTAVLDTERAVVATPRVRFDVSASSWPVRAFYSVFEQLPYASEGLIGLGVYGFSESARRRFGAFPDVIADDLFVQRLFRPDERVLVDAAFEVVAPRTTRDLLAVRTRVARGNRELSRAGTALGLGEEAAASTGGGTARALGRLGAGRPTLLPAALVYVAVTLLARRRAERSAPDAQWERDASTRSAAPAGTTPVADSTPHRVVIDGLATHAVTHSGVVRHVLSSLDSG